MKQIKAVVALIGLGAMAGAAAAQCSDWINVSPASRPSPRQDMKLVWDGDNIVCYGGYRGGFGFNDETWLWDGELWTQANPNIRPIARGHHQIAYHEASGKVILFGGFIGSGLNDTWAWDGVTKQWSELFPATVPTARYNADMCYDSNREEIVMFGGSPTVSETWTFGGTNWVQKFPATSPSARNIHSMAYDVARDRTVLFGGYGGGVRRNDTWEWDGTTWALRQAHNSSATDRPSGRSYLGLAYDSDREVVILAAGQTGPTSFERAEDTWEWDGTAWAQLTVDGMGIRDQYGLAYDEDNNNVVIHGGYGGAGGVHDDTWVLACESGGCYADCDDSEGLDLFDVLCFLNLLNAGNMDADCDDSEGLDLFDILCFLNEFNAGC